MILIQIFLILINLEFLKNSGGKDIRRAISNIFFNSKIMFDYDFKSRTIIENIERN